jgi:hypothetical protein
MLEKLTTPDFWQAQAAVMMMAPWVIMPLLVFAGGLGWILKGAQDSGEIRGLRAGKDAAEERLELAQDKQKAVTAQFKVLEPVTRNNEVEIADLTTRVARMESSIQAAILPRLDKIASTSTVVASSVHNLSAANLEVGAVLSGSGGLHASEEVLRVTQKF